MIPASGYFIYKGIPAKYVYDGDRITFDELIILIQDEINFGLPAHTAEAGGTRSVPNVYTYAFGRQARQDLYFDGVRM